MNYILLLATIFCLIASVWGAQIHLLDFEPVEGARKYFIEIKFDQKYRALTIIENKTDICTYKECVVQIPALENGASYLFTVSVEKGYGQKTLVDKGQFIAELKSGQSKCERIQKHQRERRKKDEERYGMSFNGWYEVQCLENGLYKTKQFWASPGMVWCVDIGSGIEIPNTRRGPAQGRLDCSEYAFKTKCQQTRTLNGIPLHDSTTTRCTKDGKYHMQASSYMAKWCLDPSTGETIRNTKISRDYQTIKPTFDCNKIAQEVKALEEKEKCENEHYYGSLAQRNPSINKVNTIKCTNDGLFERKQCEGGFCWCVDPEEGEEIPNTKKSGNVNC